MKEKTKGNLFRSVLSIALAIVLFLGVALVFAGCDEDDEFYDPENPSASPSFFERYVGGFNTVFANDSSGYGGIDDSEARNWSTQNFRTEFFNQISYYYGDGAALSGNFPSLSGSSIFPDSNRFYVYEETANEVTSVKFSNMHWNWFISPEGSDGYLPSLTVMENIISESESWADWVDEAQSMLTNSYNYSEAFVLFRFQNILQIVIYEIMLGYDNLTEINIDYTEGDFNDQYNVVVVPTGNNEFSATYRINSLPENITAFNILNTNEDSSIATLRNGQLSFRRAGEWEIELTFGNNNTTSKYLVTVTGSNGNYTPQYSLLTEPSNISSFDILDRSDDNSIAELINRRLEFKQAGNYKIKLTRDSYEYKFIVTNSSNSQLLANGGVLYTLNDDNNTPPSIPAVTSYIEYLQEQYEGQTRYTGFTKDNADRLIDYILDEVIGEEAVVDDYNTSRNNPTNYRNYVDTIVDIVYGLTYDGSGDSWVYSYSQIPNYTVEFDITDESGNLKGQTDFAAKPATYVRYFPGETLFGEDDVDYQFSNKPIGEYQSILVVPARTITTLLEGGIRLEAGFVFNFMSYNKDLKINAKVRYQYYNEITGYRKLFEFDCDQINFDDGYEGVDPDGRTYWENDFELSIETDELPADVVTTEKDATGYEVTYYTIGFFNNDSLLDAVAGAEGGEVTLTEFGEIQDLYKVIASQNGYGGITVLNERKINSSFFEIVLDVVKTPNDPPDTDYNFRLVLSNTLLTPGIY